MKIKKEPKNLLLGLMLQLFTNFERAIDKNILINRSPLKETY